MSGHEPRDKECVEHVEGRLSVADRVCEICSPGKRPSDRELDGPAVTLDDV